MLFLYSVYFVIKKKHENIFILKFWYYDFATHIEIYKLIFFNMALISLIV